VSRLGRVVWLGVLFHFRHLSRNAFAVMTTTIWPLVYASLAYFMFQAGAAPEALLLASLGASVMGIWSITTVDAADSIQRQRSLGAYCARSSGASFEVLEKTDISTAPGTQAPQGP